jgi:PPM family protein phosphatase
MVVPVLPRAGERVHWSSYGLTHRGLLRRRNEDALLVRPEARIYAVADGMGGHAAGNVASSLAVEVIDGIFSRPPSPRIGAPALARRLISAFDAANRAILERAAADPACAGMGTTLTLLSPLMSAPECMIGHVGDSRAYRLRDDELLRITRDHTWVQQQVDAGMLTRHQARHHPMSSVLQRVLGTPAEGPADTMLVDARPGDLFLLCSDGLTNMLEEEDLGALLLRHASVGIERLAQELVEAANMRGGHDNITVVLLAAEPA